MASINPIKAYLIDYGSCSTSW